MPVDDPEIAEVIDLADGEILNAKTFIASHRYDAIVPLRMRTRESLRSGHPYFPVLLPPVDDDDPDTVTAAGTEHVSAKRPAR